MALGEGKTAFLNRIFRAISRRIVGYKGIIKRNVVHAVSFLAYMLGNKQGVIVKSFNKRKNEEISINCMGCTYLVGDVNHYENELKSLEPCLQEVDFSFTSVRKKSEEFEEYLEFEKILNKFKLTDVSPQSTLINSTLYKSEAGNIGVVSFKWNLYKVQKIGVKIKLVKELILLKKLGADYIICYIDAKRSKQLKAENINLHQSLMELGFDYVVGINPGICKCGSTYLQKDNSVSRCVDSMGILLNNKSKRLVGRAFTRLKLRRVNGSLQAYQECYFPFSYSQETGIELLVTEKGTKALDKEKIDILSKLENGMQRINRADRVLTIGEIVDVIDAELPEGIQYLRDFSVDKFSTRAVDRQAGDVWFCWQPYNDPNDHNNYEEVHKQRMITANRLSKKVFFMISYCPLNIKTPHIVVKDVLEAHIKLCTHIREKLSVRTIVITGSIGKTSTKDMLAEVMRLQYRTVKSKKNENTNTSISLNVQNLESNCEIYIQEVGGGRPGGASRHSRMVCPETTVITNIGDAHIGNFHGDKNALMKNKLGVIEGMNENGIVYLNGDDPLLVTAKPSCKKVLYAVHNKNADYYAEDIFEMNNQTHFKIMHGEKSIDATLNVLGEHNVLNAVCCFAIGKQFCIPDEVIVEGLLNFKTYGIRQNIVKVSGRTFYLDCFNASSASMNNSIKTFKLIEKEEENKRIALIGDMTGLGETSEDAHKKIANALLDNPVDLYILHGENIKHTYDIIKKHGCNAYFVPTDDKERLHEILQNETKPGDVIMVKGSSKMALEYVIDCSFGTRFYDQSMLDEYGYFRVASSNIIYNHFKTHATAVKPTKDLENIVIKTKLGGVNVHNIASSFGNYSLKKIDLRNTIRHIGKNGFKNCKKLIEVKGTDNLMFIEDYAFVNCSSLKYIQLPETLQHIGTGAFAGCTSLEKIKIPCSVVQINEGAFDDCPDLVIETENGSYAAKWVEERERLLETIL